MERENLEYAGFGFWRCLWGIWQSVELAEGGDDKGGCLLTQCALCTLPAHTALKIYGWSSNYCSRRHRLITMDSIAIIIKSKQIYYLHYEKATFIRQIPPNGSETHTIFLLLWPAHHLHIRPCFLSSRCPSKQIIFIKGNHCSASSMPARRCIPWTNKKTPPL